jgi:hypothetical protein
MGTAGSGRGVESATYLPRGVDDSDRNAAGPPIELAPAAFPGRFGSPLDCGTAAYGMDAGGLAFRAAAR